MRHNILAATIAATLGLAALAVPAPSHAQSAAVTPEQMQALQAQIAALQAQLDSLQARTEAQSDINVSNAQAAEAGQDTQAKLDKLARLVNDTKVGGKMYFDLTHIDQQANGSDTAANGFSLDVKRFYLSVDHKFNDIWSANLTTDFQYNSSLDSASNLYVKKAYLQGRFSDAFTARIGSADLPWVGYAEKAYGYRYVENTLVDRLKYGTSADWGVHAFGDLGSDRMFNYAVSVVNGSGYKKMQRSKGMDVEARVGFTPVEGLVLAVGGYSGTLGQETGTVDALHTANRADALIVYGNDRFRVGAEYFQAENWGNVLKVASDKADGYSVWGNVAVGDKGVNLFARYDQADLSKDIDPSLQDTYYNIGVEFPVTKGFRLAAVYKDTRRESSSSETRTKELGVWGEVSF
jgi:hypothetical protein